MTDETRKEIESLKDKRLPELWSRFAELTGEETRAPNKTFLIRRITEALGAREADEQEILEFEEPEEAEEIEEPEEAEEPGEPEESEDLDDLDEQDREAPEDLEESEPQQDQEPEDQELEPEAPQPAAEPPQPPTEAPAPPPEPAPPAPQQATAAPAPEPSTNRSTVRKKLTKLSVEELRALYLEVVKRPTSSRNAAYLIWKIRQAERGKVPVGPRSARRPAGETPEVKVLPLRMETSHVEQLDAARERLGLGSRMELFRRSLHAFLIEAGEVRVAELFAPEADQ